MGGESIGYRFKGECVGRGWREKNVEGFSPKSELNKSTTLVASTNRRNRDDAKPD